MIETATLPGRTRAFHPKSWRFESGSVATDFVGSSNLSRSALDTGIEWNLRVDRAHDAQGYARVREAFAELWPRARKLDAKWIAEYAARARARPAALPPGEAEPDAPTTATCSGCSTTSSRTAPTSRAASRSAASFLSGTTA